MSQIESQSNSSRNSFTTITTVIAILMIIFGIAEVITSFTHQFFGLSTAQGDLATAVGAQLGLFYFLGGLLLLTRKTWAAITATILLCADILGRIIMVMAGLYPVDTFRQSFGIIVGTVIAMVFVVFIIVNLGLFQKS